MELFDYAKLTVEEKIERHLLNVKFDMAQYASLCRTIDDAYVPSTRMTTGGWDVHPQNKKLGQAHVSVPLVWFTVNTKSNILGMRPPDFNVKPINRKDVALREESQFIETVLDKMFVDENWEELHLNVSRTLSLYGRSVVQDGTDFTVNVDQQANVWVSYRRIGEPEAMSFSEYVSPVEAMRMGWDGKTVNEALRFDFPIYGGFPHDDPIGARAKNWTASPGKASTTDRVAVLHFYSKDTKNGPIKYSMAINGQIIKDQEGQGRKTWPFYIVEAEHIPGLTQGVGDAEPVLDLQVDISEAVTAWSETVRRTIQDQWKAWGLRHLNPRILNDGGRVWEMTDKEDEDIEPLKFIPNTVDVQQNITTLWEIYRRISSIPSEAEAQSMSHTSGYAMNVKFQALITALAPRKIRMKRMYRELAMNKLELYKKKFPKQAYLLDLSKFILEVNFQEITPSDMQAEVTRLAQAVTSKLMSPYTAMEEMNLNPEDEYALMAGFWTDPDINPQGAMASAQAKLMTVQVEQQIGGNAAPQAIAGQSEVDLFKDKFPKFTNPQATRQGVGSNVTTKVV